MHIPDGFLDAKTVTTTAALSAAGLAAAWRNVRLRLPQEKIPLLGLSAAFVFAAQMLNFPVAGGTSGHLMGSVLTTILLGPGAAIIVMSSVLIVQCLIFADGGLLALGANVFNMGIVGVLSGHLVYRSIVRLHDSTAVRMLAIAAASWFSVLLAALCCAGELAWSRVVDWQSAFATMGSIHALIGAGEAVITCLVAGAILSARPDLLLRQGDTGSPPAGSLVTYGFITAFGIVLFIYPFASSWPDGLERAAALLGFDTAELSAPIVPGIMPGYAVPGIDSGATGTIVAGIAGIVALMLAIFLLTRLLRHRA